MIRKMRPDSFAFSGCRRGRGRVLAWRSRDEDVVRKVPAAAGNSHFERWQRSFSFDRRLLKCVLTAGQQRTRASTEGRGHSVVRTQLICILQGLKQIGEKAAESPAFLDDDEAEDVHHFVEKQLVTLIGDTGYKLHSGRSRNEQIATDLRLYVRATIDQLRLQRI